MNYSSGRTSRSVSLRTTERPASSVTPFLLQLLNATVWSFPFMKAFFSLSLSLSLYLSPGCLWASGFRKLLTERQSNAKYMAGTIKRAGLNPSAVPVAPLIIYTKKSRRSRFIIPHSRPVMCLRRLAWYPQRSVRHDGLQSWVWKKSIYFLLTLVHYFGFPLLWNEPKLIQPWIRGTELICIYLLSCGLCGSSCWIPGRIYCVWLRDSGWSPGPSLFFVCSV